MSARRPRRFALCALVLVALAPATAGAAILAGAVRGAGRPLVGANVRILELDRATATGRDGAYRFPDVPPGAWHVHANLVGFAPGEAVVTVGGDSAEASFDLAASAIPLEQIVVSASPDAQPARELAVSASSRTREQLLAAAGQSFADELSDLPGVNVRGLGAAPNRPVLRGLSDNRVLVLENGLRTGDLATYDPAHATPVEAVAIDEVDVVRGPASVLYGPSAIGGLVNLRTRLVPAVSGRPFTGTLVSEGNSVSDLYAGHFDGTWSGRRTAFAVSGGGVHAQSVRIPSKIYVDPGSGRPYALDRLPHSFDRSSEGGAGWAYQGDFGSIGVGGRHYENDYGIPGAPPGDDPANFPPSTSRIAQRRNTFELDGVYHGRAVATRRLKLNAAFNDYHHAEFPTAQDAGGVSEPQANRFHMRAWNARLQYEARPACRLASTLGAWTNVENLTVGGDEPLGPNSLTTGFAGYLFEEYRASATTRLELGARFDANRIATRPDPSSTDSVFRTSDESRTAHAVTAQLGLARDLGGGLTATLGVGRSFRAPTVQELFADGLDAPSGTYTRGTPTLDPETGLGLDASLKGRGARWEFEVAPYANLVRDYIYGFLTGGEVLGFPERVFQATDARLVGFDASATVQLAGSLALHVAADYVNAEDTRADAPLPFTPPLRGLVRATWQRPAWSALAEWRGAARQTRLGEGDTETAGWGIVNLGVGARTHAGRSVHTLGLHCDNLFDRDYRDHLSVIKDFLPQPGRGFRLDYELSF